MIILCSGITGFQPAPTVKENNFKQICYKTLGSKVIEFVGKEASQSFYECIVKMRDNRVHILLNSQYPFMAFTSARQVYTDSFPFINEPDLANSFKQHYKILHHVQLTEPLIYKQKGKKVIVENRNDLHKEELKQIAYWEPKTVGDVVFNYWD